jgi:uroporphyrinogen decarboxylase
MFDFLLKHPAPDFEALIRVLKGQDMPRRVHIIELGVDAEILKAIADSCSAEPWLDLRYGFEDQPPEIYYRQQVRMYYELGYDCAPIWAAWPGHPSPRQRIADNTAALAAGKKRHWTEEGYGLITSWEAFEAFPWDTIRPDPLPCVIAARYLPDGMKITAGSSYFEHIFENLIGYEALAYLLYDEPELVEQIFQRWGEKVYGFYESVIGLDAVGGIFHADDMGFKTSTLLAPDALRRLVLPWHQRFAALAHQHGKVFFIHSCGNLYRQGIIDVLIDVVRIDGFHSFQDVILPVNDFKDRYGARVGTLGGVDMDKLARLDPDALRPYVRGILDHCMPLGRFAMGSGNTISNYVPLENYAVLLDECRRWNA